MFQSKKAVLANIIAARDIAGWIALMGPISGGAYGSKNQILSASEAQGRDTNSVMADWVDRGPWLYWDTVTFLPNTQVAPQYSPFSVPIGAQDPLTNVTKTKLQTNLQRGNQFPPPKCLLLIQIGFSFIGMTNADIVKILTSAYMEFRIDEKIFHEGLLDMYPSGTGLNGVTQNSGESSWFLGLPSPLQSRRYGDWAKYIAPLQQFSMNLIFGGGGSSAGGSATIPAPTLTSGGYMKIYLDGLTDRSVQ